MKVKLAVTFSIFLLFACSGGEGGMTSSPTANVSNSAAGISSRATSTQNTSAAASSPSAVAIQGSPQMQVVPAQWGRRTRRLPVTAAGLNSNAVSNINAQNPPAAASSLHSNTNANAQDFPAGVSSSSPNTNFPNPLAGTWVGAGHRLMFNADNTYSGDVNRAGMPEVWGTIAISGNIIMVADTGGNRSCRQHAADETVNGAYTYTISGNELTFSPVYDPCSQRVALLGLTYHKQ